MTTNTADVLAEPRTIATMRLREALDMERATSGGNAMTPLRVAQFISGPWLDYIAEPYLAELERLRAVEAAAHNLRAAWPNIVHHPRLDNVEAVALFAALAAKPSPSEGEGS